MGGVGLQHHVQLHVPALQVVLPHRLRDIGDLPRPAVLRPHLPARRQGAAEGQAEAADVRAAGPLPIPVRGVPAVAEPHPHHPGDPALGAVEPVIQDPGHDFVSGGVVSSLTPGLF